MRIARITIISALLLAFMPVAGAAQDKRVHFNLGGGPTLIFGDLAERFDAGLGTRLRRHVRRDRAHRRAVRVRVSVVLDSD